MNRFIGIVVAAGAAASASANTTGVNNPGFAGEFSHQQIMESIFTQDFGPVQVFSAGDGFTVLSDDLSQSIEVIRVADFGGLSPLDSSGSQIDAGFDVRGGTPEFDDDVWTNGLIEARARATFAGFDQTFGFKSGVSDADQGGDFVELFEVEGSGMDVTGSAIFDAGDLDLFRWARNGDGELFTSNGADNSDGLDHMVTYFFEIDGVANWLLFWEDLPERSSLYDGDFNDLVVQLAIVPTPQAAVLALAGLGGLMAVRRRGL